MGCFIHSKVRLLVELVVIHRSDDAIQLFPRAEKHCNMFIGFCGRSCLKIEDSGDMLTSVCMCVYSVMLTG